MPAGVGARLQPSGHERLTGLQFLSLFLMKKVETRVSHHITSLLTFRQNVATQNRKFDGGQTARFDDGKLTPPFVWLHR
jgi:hypothetical protein